jgi:hypothetical protein
VADTSAYLQQLAGWIGRALANSEGLFAQFSTESLGLRLPDAVIADAGVAGALQHAKAAAQNMDAVTQGLDAPAGSGDDEGRYVRYGAGIAEYFVRLTELSARVSQAITPATVPDPAERAAAAQFASALYERLASLVLASMLTETAPPIALVLKLMGLLRWEWKPADPAVPQGRDYVDLGLELFRVSMLISDPERHFRESPVRWGAADFDPTSFFRIYQRLFHVETNVRLVTMDNDPALLQPPFLVRRQSALAPPGLEVRIAALPPPIDLRTELNTQWGIGLKTSVDLASAAVLTIKPPLDITLAPDIGQPSGQLELYANRNDDARPFDILDAGGFRLAANDARFGVGFKAAWQASNAAITPLVSASVSGGKVSLDTSNADGFIGTLLGSAKLEGQFDLAADWNASDGLRITGSGGIEIALPIHKSLGPVDFNTLYIGLVIGGDSGLALETSAGLGGHLGPVTAVVDRIGTLTHIRFAEHSDGSFGPFDLSTSFKAPNGVGLVIDAGAVKGGGYLFFDPDRGEYAGCVDLVFSGVVALKAIGIITTKAPDGGPGFSLLVVMSVEFGTGIQLGLGFTLLAVGGIVGVNRSINLTALMDGVRTDAVSSALFPRDIIANAQKIVSDLSTLFPPRNGTSLIGPMAKLGWGTPKLLTLSLGVLIEIPGNVAIIGVLKVALPTEDQPVVKLQVNFAGAIEFDRKRLYFYASLFDSRVVFVPVVGDMGVLSDYSDDDPSLVVSVGGFHPRFDPPPLPFPAPKEVSLDLLNKPGARVRLDGYFAVTSNTTQFGAKVDVYFGLSALNVQGHFAFDALFQRSPFRCIIDFNASLSAKVFGVGLFSVGVKGTLDGPGPWHVKGHGSISLLFWDIGVDFEQTWGDPFGSLLDVIEVLALAAAELAKDESWRAILPPASDLRVSVRSRAPDEGALVLHPLGVLRVAQRALPLTITLDKIGDRKPSDVNRVTLAAAAGSLVKSDDAYELFAPAQFQDFSDADKLSKPSFAPEQSGIDLSSGADLASSLSLSRSVRYEEIILDANAQRFAQPPSSGGPLFDFFRKGAAVGKCAVSQASKRRLSPFTDGVAVVAESYTVAFAADNRAVAADAAAFRSEARAREYMNRMLAQNAALADTLHVIPAFEAA